MSKQVDSDPNYSDRLSNILAWASRQRFVILAVVLGAAALAALPVLGPLTGDGVKLARTNLPLSLPILMVLVSIAVRIHELAEVRGWLGLCNRFASGVVTFAIWAMVSGASAEQFIWINDEMVLDKEYATVLVVAAFLLMIACSLVTVLAERPEPNKHQRAWQSLQAVLVAVSLVALVGPYYLFEKKDDAEKRTGQSLEIRAYTVAVGYRDAAFNQFVGRSASPVQQCAILRSVAAKDAEEARRFALESFLESEASNQFVPVSDRSASRTPRKVETETSWVVAEAESETPASRSTRKGDTP